jgi:hypothetical protein
VAAWDARVAQQERDANQKSIERTIDAFNDGVARGRSEAMQNAIGPKPNDGNAKPHGGADHDKAIDKEVSNLKKDPSVSNIRKNQQQVDVNGNKVGTNRPDVQYDQNGKHNCVEFDKCSKRSQAHGQTINSKDPNAVIKLNML